MWPEIIEVNGKSYKITKEYDKFVAYIDEVGIQRRIEKPENSHSKNNSVDGDDLEEKAKQKRKRRTRLEMQRDGK